MLIESMVRNNYYLLFETIYNNSINNQVNKKAFNGILMSEIFFEGREKVGNSLIEIILMT